MDGATIVAEFRLEISKFKLKTSSNDAGGCGGISGATAVGTGTSPTSSG